MILTKYDEIMEKVNLTPEARERIIKNVAEAAEDKGGFRHIKKKSSMTKYLALAACCILVIAGIKTASDRGAFDNVLGGSSSDMAVEENEYAGTPELSDGGMVSESAASEEEYGNDQYRPESKGTEAVWEAEFFEGEKELSDYLGFTMGCPAFSKLNMEAGMDTVSYLAVTKEIGEISFDNGDEVNYFRKARGTEDISGDYNEYKYMAEFDGEKRSGTLKGNSPERYELAVWTSADGYTYAAYVTGGIPQEEWQKIIDESVSEGD